MPKKEQKALKDFRYHISYYIIIPAIFAGYAVLASTITFRLTEYCQKHNISTGLPVFWTILVISVVGFLCGLSVFRVVIKPLNEFVRSASAVLPADTDAHPKVPMEQAKEWELVLKRVTSVLSMVDIRQLFPEIVAESKIMRAILTEVTKIAPSDSTVLITGESGTGKELIASSIFEQSLRKDKPFIKLNCVAIPDGLWESELFGHEKGAFTGATKRKIGKFELANEGTLFLDEIGDMPLKTQAKLLRVLQEREFERVGGTKTIKVDVRFIAATNKDLEKMVEEKSFRDDLFFRLNVIHISLPPLRERKDDIQRLAEHFCSLIPKKKIEITPLAMRMLIENSHWPGNIRELKNIIERAGVLCEDGIIEPRHLPDNLVGEGFVAEALTDIPYEEDAEFVSFEEEKELNLDDQIRRFEKQLIINALRKTNGIQVQAARLLGIKERALWHRVKKYEIDAKAFKNE